jgi:GntR family transcriptional regulator
MLDKSVDKSSSVPLYYQLKNLILDQIDTGRLGRDDQLPSEREIGDLYGISRHTVRQAINELVLQGILYRAPGKGTYVAPRKVIQDLLHVTSFTQMILDWGKSTSVRAISSDVVPAPPFVSRLLNLPANAKAFQFERLRIVDREPVALHRSYVPEDIAQPLLAVSLDSQSLLGLLADECGVRIVHSQETMEPTIADRYEAELLNVKQGAPLQLITGRLLSDVGHPVECHKSLYRGDKFQFAFEGVLDQVRASKPTRERPA